MTNTSPLVWEDDEYVYIPEELVQHLPPEYLQSFETRKQQSEDVLRIAGRACYE